MDNMASAIDYTTILTPASCFILGAPLRLRTIWSRSAAVKGATRLQITKLAVAMSFVGLQLSLVVLNASKPGPSVKSSRLSPPILAFVAALIATILSQWEHSRSIRPSYVLQTYLLTTLLGRLVHVYLNWMHIASSSGRAIEICTCAVTAVFLVVESFRKDAILLRKKKYPPQALRGVFGQRLFLWLNRLFQKGYNTVFELNSLGKIDEELSSLDNCRQLRLEWLKFRTQTSQNLLLRSLAHSLRFNLLFPIVPRILLLAVNFAQPWLIQRLLKYTGESTKRTREGVLLICAAAALYTCLAIFQSWYWQSVCRFQTKVRFCLTTAIYDKSLRSRTKTSPLTLMNVDVEKALFGIRPIHEYWASAFSITVAFGLLYTQIGVCFIAPLVLVIALATVTISNGVTVGPRQKSWLEATQARIIYITDAIRTMKAIKLHGSVISTIQKGTALREKEVAAQKIIRKSLLINTVISQTAFTALALATYCAYGVRTRITGQPLTNQNLFTSLAILKLISTPMLGAVQYIPNTLQSLAALRRIQSYLESEDRYDQRVCQASRMTTHKVGPQPFTLSPGDQVRAGMCNASCGYPGMLPFLINVNCEFRQGGLHIIVGGVGSGKSTLLRTLLGEVDISHGSIYAPGIIAYCDQTTWLWDGTIQENIVGICEYDEAWFKRVIWACGLDRDLQRMPVGSNIGDGGSSLSGGQRNRVSLARAVYSRIKFVLLDDVLSGLDSRTEMIVFSRVLGPNGILRSNHCTVILATSSKHWQSYADSIVVLERGQEITQSFSNQTGSSKLDESSSSRHLLEQDLCQQSTEIHEAELPPSFDQQRPVPQPKSDSEVYKQYFQSFGIYHTSVYFAILIVSVGAVQMQSVWLKWWAAEDITSHAELTAKILVFTAISCAAIVCLGFLLGFSLLKLLVRSSLHLHARQWEALMNVTFVAWGSKNIGGIINRFSQDIMIIDTQLAMAFINTAMQVCTSIASIVLLIVATPYIGAAVPFLCAIFWVIQRVYLRTSKQLRTIDLEAKAPLCAHFLQSASGITTIRAFGWSETYREMDIMLLRNSQIPYYLLASVQNWLSLVLNLIVAGLATTVVSIAFNVRGLDSGYFGLALTGIMDIGFYFEVLITSWTSLETSLGAIARMNEFVRDMPQEQEGQTLPSPSWPAEGGIIIQNLTASYSEDPSTSPALKDVTLHIKPGEKIAICGRTGSGKSSTIAAIFGLLHVNHGSITIDDLETRCIEPSSLRSAILLLTQEPYFIPGTVRENLLFHESDAISDSAIISVLEKTELKDKLHAIKGDTDILNMDLVLEDMLTKGEMQLFAIARTLLSTSKILILDEPTSGLDHKSDEIVRRALWEHCTLGNRTVITIAHKLHSIIDYDTVVVMDAGRIVEMGSPSELAGTKGSMFAELLSRSS